MDFNSLKDTVSNLTLYDLKAGVRKVQNAVMNYTEMESKVREATNNEPWGASSTLMQEIANGTFNYQQLNEIMPMIYRRFTEKAAEEWRQIYKALQLLEFLIKNGSERVIDDARSHLTLLKMLRQFHFIDQNGKDQGINIRNRAKELADLLSDVERIRAERKKARANRQKYTGVEGGGGTFGVGGSGSRFGGFGNESGGQGDSYGAYSGGVYGDGGGFSGGQSSDFRDSSRRAERFEEYDEFDEGDRPAPSAESSRVKRSAERVGVKKTAGGEPPKEKKPEVDLFSFDEPASAPAASALPPSNGSGLAALSNTADEDEFDDFQSATPSAQAAQPSFAGSIAPPPGASTSSALQFAAPKPVSAPQQANLTSMVGLSSISPTSSSTATPTPNYSSFSSPLSPAVQPPRPAGYQAAQPNYFQSVQSGATQVQPTASASGMGGAKPAFASSAVKPAAAGGDAFGALWSQASAGIKKTDTPGSTVAMGQLAKEKSAAGIWGAPASAKPSAGASSGGSGGLGDLLG